MEKDDFSGHRERRTIRAGKFRVIYLHINHNLDEVTASSKMKYSPAMQITWV